ncbi:MAG: 4Fe-4S binding protein [Dehalococcoidales bacterium]|nr:4Fe-4S binding protein [Dehalococcoidales bacterium]
MRDAKKKALEMIKKKIDPIYKELAEKVQPGLGSSKYCPWILERLMTVQQAKIALALPDVEREATLDRLEVSDGFAKKLNLDKKVINRDIHNLYEKGFIFPTKKGPQSPRNFDQWLDTQNNAKFDKELGEEYYALLAIICDEEISKVREEERVAKRLKTGQLLSSRIIPRWKAIKDIPGVLPQEDVRAMLNHNEVFAIAHCACRKRYKEGDCGVPEDLCLLLGRNAEYNIGRGSARQITREEAFDLIDNETVKYPVAHVGSRTDTPLSPISLICNCHACCCEVLRKPMVLGSKYPVWEFYAKSRFRTSVDPAKCTGCRLCADKRCQFGAVQMKFYPEYGGERAYVDEAICMGCGACVETCPAGARSMRIVEPPDPDTAATQAGPYFRT